MAPFESSYVNAVRIEVAGIVNLSVYLLKVDVSVKCFTNYDTRLVCNHYVNDNNNNTLGANYTFKINIVCHRPNGNSGRFCCKAVRLQTPLQTSQAIETIFSTSLTASA